MYIFLFCQMISSQKEKEKGRGIFVMLINF